MVRMGGGGVISIKEDHNYKKTLVYLNPYQYAFNFHPNDFSSSFR